MTVVQPGSRRESLSGGGKLDYSVKVKNGEGKTHSSFVDALRIWKGVLLPDSSNLWPQGSVWELS